MKKITISLLLIISTLSAFAQDFTLENQYKKMIRKYPFIKPYLPSDSGLYVEKDIPYFKSRNSEKTLCFDYISLTDRTVPRPLVIFVHGGGWASGSKEMDHAMAIALARKGFSCVCIDYLKSGISKYPEAVIDVSVAVRMAKKYPEQFGCNGQICFVGSSAGGQLASLVGANDNYLFDTTQNDTLPVVRVDRVIDIDGVLAFIHPDSSEGQDKLGKISAATQWLGTSVKDDPELWNEASPLYHVNDQSADYTFIVGTQKRFTAGINEMCDSLRIHGHSAKIVRIFADGKERNPNEIVSESETPHCFWLFSPWAEYVVDAMFDALSDWIK